MKPGARGDTAICSLLVDEYIEVAFGSGTSPMKNESEYSWFHADTLKYRLAAETYEANRVNGMLGGPSYERPGSRGLATGPK